MTWIKKVLAGGKLLPESLAARTDAATIRGLQLSIGASVLFGGTSLARELVPQPRAELIQVKARLAAEL